MSDIIIERIAEHMETDELIYYLEEHAGKEAVIRCLVPLILTYKREFKEDYPWLV